MKERLQSVFIFFKCLLYYIFVQTYIKLYTAVSLYYNLLQIIRATDPLKFIIWRLFLNYSGTNAVNLSYRKLNVQCQLLIHIFLFTFGLARLFSLLVA